MQEIPILLNILADEEGVVTLQISLPTGEPDEYNTATIQIDGVNEIIAALITTQQIMYSLLALEPADRKKQIEVYRTRLQAPFN